MKAASWHTLSMAQRLVIDELGMEFFNEFILRQIDFINSQMPTVWDAAAKRERYVRVIHYACTGDLLGHYERFMASVRPPFITLISLTVYLTLTLL